MTRAEIASVLKKTRMTAGLTQTEAAKSIGRKQQTLASWETGQSQPDANTLFKLFDVYGASVDEAFGYTKKSTAPVETEAEGLSTDEKELLKGYNKLNKDGQEEAHEHMEFLLTKQKYLRPEYIKSDNSKELA